MNRECTAAEADSVLPSVSDVLDPLGGLLRSGVLDPPPRPGVLAALDRFEILRLVGIGGMGLVFLARDPSTAGHVAIKLLKPELVRTPLAVQRFLVEARHMQQMEHPGVLKVMEVSDRSEGPYFVMPYMPRGSLAGLIRPGEPLDYGLTLGISRQIAEALAYAHSKGIIHRDLKPGNVLLDAAGRAYLADFGLLKTVYDDSALDVRRTHYEGTGPYTSPAVAAGEEEDTRRDIYALGAMLYEMLTGMPPYGGETTREVLQHIVSGPPRPILALNPGAPMRLVQLAEGAMARELRDRYAQAADLAGDLMRIEDGADPLGPRGGAKPGRAARNRLPSILFAVLVLVVAVAAVMFWPGENGPANARTPPGTGVRSDMGLSDAFARAPGLEDDFADSAIDTGLWRVVGRRGGAPGLGTGSWKYSFTEGGSPDGYLEARVWGPASGISYWGEASARTLYDFNDGRRWLINFTWEARVSTGRHVDVFAFQVTDGGFPNSGNGFWMLNGDLPGTVTLGALGNNVSTRPLFPSPPLSKRTWSLTIEPAGKATLYPAPNGEGGSLSETALDPSRKWHVRFLALDATSAGFPPGDDAFRLYDFSAYPERQESVSYGDVLSAIALPHDVVETFAVVGSDVYYTAIDARESRLFQRGIEDLRGREIGRLAIGRGIAVCRGVLYGVEAWPGRLFRIDRDGSASLVRRLKANWPQDITFNGTNLWYVERSPMENRYGVHAMELGTGRAVAYLASGDREIAGLAWGRGRLWVSSLRGDVCEVAPAPALDTGKLESGIVGRFRGTYSRLSFEDGSLWGLDKEANRLCKIDLGGGGDPPLPTAQPRDQRQPILP